MQDLRLLIFFRSSGNLYLRNQVFFSRENIKRITDIERQQNENTQRRLYKYIYIYMCVSKQNA